jgi:hypothetical protein
MLIEELIEKAFCDGYKYAQREYTKILNNNIIKKKKPDFKKLLRNNDGGKGFVEAIQATNPALKISDIDNFGKLK